MTKQKKPRIEMKWNDKACLTTNTAKYYKACTFGDVTYNIGDSVFVQVQSRTEKANLICLWENVDGIYLAEVRYFMPASRVKEDMKGMMSDDMILETDQCDQIEISWLRGHATVESSKYLYSVFTHVLKPLESGPTCYDRSVHVFSRQAELHPALLDVLAPIQKQKQQQQRQPFANRSDESVVVKFQTVCKQLQLAIVPEDLPCREKQRDLIYAFLKKAISIGESAPLYINGLQGIGKTATVMQVLRQLGQERDEGRVGDFEYIEINAMKLPKPELLYTHLWRKITKHHSSIKTISAEKARQYLSAHFTDSQQLWPTTVLLIDEIDCILNRTHTVLYNLLNWPRQAKSNLVVIGIANTMDLPEQLERKLGSRLGVERIQFQPYAWEQIETIVNARIGQSNIFDPIALRVFCKKIALHSGDIRMALNLCQAAVEAVLKRLKDDPYGTPKVTFEDINDVMRIGTVSPQVSLLRSLSSMQYLLIASLANESQLQRVDEVHFMTVLERMVALSRTKGLLELLITPYHALQVCDSLDESRIIRCHRKEKEKYPLLRLNIDVHQIILAWKSHPFGTSMLSDAILTRYS